MMHKNERHPHKYQVGIVGVRGYSGVELARVLLGHPAAGIEACYVTGDTQPAEYFPRQEAASLRFKPMAELENDAGALHTVFLATPAEVSVELAPKLIAKGCHVVDLSGAFRLQAGDPAALYKKWYGFEHPAPQLLKGAIYGLFPWAAAKAVGSGPQLVANPGCYATSVLLAVLPLLQAGAVEPDSLVIDAKSGTSGAGRKAAENLLFTEVDGECLPYRVGRHQHLPEIMEAFSGLAGVGAEPVMATHLLPVRRGILSSIYLRLAPGKDAGSVAAAYAKAYEGYPLVEVEELPATDGRASQFALSLRRVVGTPSARILYRVDGNRLYLFSLIDNLMKGAATQAVENFNRLASLAPETGLLASKGVL